MATRGPQWFDDDENATSEKTFGQRMRKAYVIALAIIAALSIGAFVALDGFITRQGNAASVISAANSQLILTQRIVGFTQSLVRRDTDTTYGMLATVRDSHYLNKAVIQLEKAHKDLTRGDPARGLPGISTEAERALYEDAPHMTNNRMKYFLEDVRKVVASPDSPNAAAISERILKDAQGGLLRALVAVESYYEEMARKSAKRAQRVHLSILLATILVLIGEAIVIFRPLAMELARTEKVLDAKTAELSHQSIHDPLTGIMNRRGLKKALRAFKAGGDLSDYALIMIDLDNFKLINDTHGHDVGDEMLKSVAGILKKNLRYDDICVRMGGDEFLIIASLAARFPTKIVDDETASDGGQRDPEILLAERLIQEIKQHLSKDRRFALSSASAGVAKATDQRTEFETLLTNADLALYHAKAQGRNRVARYDTEFRSVYESRRHREVHIRDALERDGFEPFFQPQIDMRSGEVIGVEALARMRDPKGGLVPPAEFLDIAERTQLIVPVGKMVIAKAVQIAQSWQEAGIEFGQLSINASAEQLRDPGFIPFLKTVLEETGFPASRLAVEVLESVVLDERDETIIEVCKAIRGLGAYIELDDFGTGYASIANVDRLGVNRIKIDKSLLNQPIRVGSRDILGAMIAVARSLQLDVLTEGVETEEHELRLMALGCYKVQGYRFAKPMSAGALLRWFGENQDTYRSLTDSRPALIA